jgi:hypothetical protein
LIIFVRVTSDDTVLALIEQRLWLHAGSRIEGWVQ